MLKLGARLLALLGLVILGSFATIVFSFNAQTPKYSYLGGIVDKHARLRRKPAPRIVLVGGSSMAFGVDSARLGQAQGLPVINMALHAAVGLRYMLSEVQPELEAGDIVIVSAEYDQFYGYFNGKETLLDLLMVYPQGIGYFSSPQQYQAIVEGFPITLQEMFRGALDRTVFGNKEVNPVYRRDAFNAEGDVVSHLDRPAQDISKIKFSIAGTLDNESMHVLGDFARTAKRRGARVFFAFPPLSKRHYQSIRNQAQALCDALKQESGLTLLASPGESVFPENFFFDTVYHLNRAGREARTLKLISDLKQGLDGKPGVNCQSAD